MAYKDKEKQREAQRKYEKEKRGSNSRRSIWWGYLYPDSAPEDWKERISAAGIECVVGHHDKDVTATGEEKKEHFHVAIRFSHAKTKAEAIEVLTDFGVLEKSVQYRDSWRAVCRYMVHADDPDKFQYSDDAVTNFCGADWKFECRNNSDKHRVCREMRKFIRENCVTSFSEFVDYCDENNEEWQIALDDNCSYVIHEYIKSKRYDFMEGR